MLIPVLKKVEVEDGIHTRHFLYIFHLLFQGDAIIYDHWVFLYVPWSIHLFAWCVLCFTRCCLNASTFIVAVIAKVEKLPNVRRWNGALKMFGVLFAVGGALMTTFGKQQQHKTNEVKDDNKSEVFHVLGYLCIIYNTLSMALLAVLQKKYIFENTSSRWKSSPVNVIAWSYFFGFLSMALASLYYYNQPEKFSSINNSAIYVLIYAVFITSALCYMLITWVNTKISASLVTAFWPLQVLFCVVLAYFVTGETLNALEICGGILVIFSLLAVIWSNFQEEKEKAFSVNKDFHDEKPLIH